MSDAVRALAEQSVPRYTSYPTAPHFSAVVGAREYADWLTAVPKQAALSVYVHVPFCSRLCHYCGCHTKAVRRREPIETYADTVIEEITLLGSIAAGGRVINLHWGGGTPSLLGAERLAQLLAKIDEAFPLAPECEHAIELDPRYVTRELARALVRLGVNRVSLGVQEFAGHVQEAIGRIQPFELVERATLELREAGIARVNLDLMYGLPRQTVEDIRRTASLAASLEPQRLAYFGYAHVPWLKTHQRLIDDALLPGASERLLQSQAARATLTSRGYVPIGIDHFALPDDDLASAAHRGELRRNFQGYTTDRADALIGLGASAIGRLAGGFVQNATDTAGFARSISAGQLATARGIELTADDRLRSRIIERLMCDFSVDLGALGAECEHGWQAEVDALAPLAVEGLVRLDGSRRLCVTDKGRPFVRLVAAAFDAYLAKARARHSVAV